MATRLVNQQREKSYADKARSATFLSPNDAARRPRLPAFSKMLRPHFGGAALVSGCANHTAAPNGTRASIVSFRQG